VSLSIHIDSNKLRNLVMQISPYLHSSTKKEFSKVFRSATQQARNK
jgi:hypothetical protein